MKPIYSNIFLMWWVWFRSNIYLVLVMGNVICPAYPVNRILSLAQEGIDKNT